MSLDLLKEFGPSNQEILENPWTSDSIQSNIKSDSKAEIIGDEDDFGDFEVPDNQNPIHSSGKSVLSTQVSLERGKLHSIIDKNSLLDETPSKLSNTSNPAEDDEWGDFIEDTEDISVYHNGSKDDGIQRNDEDNKIRIFGPLESPVGIAHSIGPLQVGPVSAKPSSSKIPRGGNVLYQGPPPFNVPPPSILLLLITTLFEYLSTDLKNVIPLIEPNASSQTPIDHVVVDKLSTHLAMVRAAARTIAGRKLRWRRDHHLSQSMKIGPAHAAKAGGMKLTGIDRTENRREDREAEEAIRTWKQSLGSLRATIAIINHHQLGLNLTIPEISDMMPVRQAKPSEGAISAPVCCFLCGVKRDERVDKIDTDIEDSFGEWWTDHWGHVDCTIFWKEQERSLQQR